MATGTTVVADEMKERLQLFLNEGNCSVIMGMQRAWEEYVSAGRQALYWGQLAGRRMTRAREVLERFGDSWEEWVVTRGEAGIAPFSVKQAERLICLHEMMDQVKFDGSPERRDFVAHLSVQKPTPA